MNWVPSFSGEEFQMALIVMAVPAILTFVVLITTGRERTAIMFGFLLILLVVLGALKVLG